MSPVLNDLSVGSGGRGQATAAIVLLGPVREVGITNSMSWGCPKGLSARGKGQWGPSVCYFDSGFPKGKLPVQLW